MGTRSRSSAWATISPRFCCSIRAPRPRRLETNPAGAHPIQASSKSSATEATGRFRPADRSSSAVEHRSPRRWRRLVAHRLMVYGRGSMARLDGQVGLVTGGGRGIGAAVARELAAAGMRIAVTGRTRAQVETVADGIGGLGLVGDVSRQSDVEGWVAETERRLGPIDLLVNNAAVVG